MTTYGLQSWSNESPILTDTLQCSVLQSNEKLSEEYTEHVINAQAHQLDPLKEDLSEWLNKILGIDYINRENFITQLDNGVILYHLAQVIQEYAQNATERCIISGPVPTVKGKCFEKATRRSFYSRDNMDNFLKFCRSMGVHENLLFESDDLVLHNQPRNVILCIFELARLATKYNVEPPGLVKLEKEIAEEELVAGVKSMSSYQSQCESETHDTKMYKRRTSNFISSIRPWNNGSNLNTIKSTVSNSKFNSRDTFHALNKTNKTSTNDIQINNIGNGDCFPSDGGELDTYPEQSIREQPHIGTNKDRSQSGKNVITELDRKIHEATIEVQNKCQCPKESCIKMHVRKVGEGKYNIAGRNVFVRLLKGRHMMVRVGGGWDTLNHFLLRHDPCQVKIVARIPYREEHQLTTRSHLVGGGDTVIAQDTRQHNIIDSPITNDSTSKYLHIRAKYRSPPPVGDRNNTNVKC